MFGPCSRSQGSRLEDLNRDPIVRDMLAGAGFTCLTVLYSAKREKKRPV